MYLKGENLVNRKRTRIGLCLILVGVIITALVFINAEDKEDLDSPKNAEIEVSTEKEIYEKGEKVNITVALVNNNSEEITYDFSGNPKLELAIYDSLENTIWNISFEIPSTITIIANSEHILLDKLLWNQKNNASESIFNGTYQIEANLNVLNINSNTTIEIGNYIRVVTDKDVYKKGENVTIWLILVNNQNKTVTYWFPSDLQFEMFIFDKNGAEIFNISQYNSGFLCVITNITLSPHSEKILGVYNLKGEKIKNETCIWNQTNKYKHVVSAGRYQISGRLNGYSYLVYLDIKGEKIIQIKEG